MSSIDNPIIIPDSPEENTIHSSFLSQPSANSRKIAFDDSSASKPNGSSFRSLFGLRSPNQLDEVSIERQKLLEANLLRAAIELNTLKQQLNEAEKGNLETEKLRGNLKRMMSENAALQENLKTVTRVHSTLVKENMISKRKANVENLEFWENLKLEMNEKCDSIYAEKQKLHENLERLTSEHNALKEKSNGKLLENLKGVKEKVELENEKLRENLRRLTSEHNELKGSLVDKEKSNLENEKLLEKLKIATSEHIKLSKKCLADMEEVGLEKEKLHENLNRLTNENSALKERLVDKEKSDLENEKLLRRMTREHTALNKKLLIDNEKVYLENQKLLENLKRATSEHNALKDRYLVDKEKADLENEKLRENLKRVTNEHSVLKERCLVDKEKDGLENKKLQETLKKVTSKHNALNERLIDMEKEVEMILLEKEELEEIIARENKKFEEEFDKVTDYDDEEVNIGTWDCCNDNETPSGEKERNKSKLWMIGKLLKK